MESIRSWSSHNNRRRNVIILCGIIAVIGIITGGYFAICAAINSIKGSSQGGQSSSALGLNELDNGLIDRDIYDVPLNPEVHHKRCNDADICSSRQAIEEFAVDLAKDRESLNAVGEASQVWRPNQNMPCIPTREEPPALAEVPEQANFLPTEANNSSNDLRGSGETNHIDKISDNSSAIKSDGVVSEQDKHKSSQMVEDRSPTATKDTPVNVRVVRPECSCCVRYDIPKYEASRPITWIRTDVEGGNRSQYILNIDSRGKALHDKTPKVPMVIKYLSKAQSSNCIHIDMLQNHKRSKQIETLVDVPGLLALTPKDSTKHFCKILYGRKTLATLKDINPLKTIIIHEKVMNSVQFSIWVKERNDKQHLLQLLLLKGDVIINNNYPIYLDVLLKAFNDMQGNR